MRPVRLTDVEGVELELTLHDARANCTDPFRCKVLDKVLAKVAAALEVDTKTGVSVVELEQALERTAGGKFVPLTGGWPKAGAIAKNVGATVSDAELIGAWMWRQGWLHGPNTLLDVLRNWHSWLPKARATQPPPGVPAGLGANATRQTTGPG